jgi:hypothetical protein
MSVKGSSRLTKERIEKYFQKDCSRGSIKRACKELGVARDTLIRAAHIYGIDLPQHVPPPQKETTRVYEERIRRETGHSPKIARDLNRLDPRGILLRSCKGRAKSAGIEFDLQISDILLPEYCPVLGIPLRFNLGNKRASDNSPTVDRIDNSKGYLWNNIIVVSWRANRIKNDSTVKELRAIADFYEKVSVATDREPLEKARTTGDKKLSREVEDKIKEELSADPAPSIKDTALKYGVDRITIYWILKGQRVVTRDGKLVKVPRYED